MYLVDEKTIVVSRNHLMQAVLSGVIILRKLAHAIYRDLIFCSEEKFQWRHFDFFNIFAQNIHCGYTLEPPRRGGSNGYPQCIFWIKNKKNR